jgi:hypothetical protein
MQPSAVKECALFGCGKQFEPGRRANRHGHADDRHGGALYCSPRCRQRAYRLRHSRTVTPRHLERAAERVTLLETSPIARTVTPAPAAAQRRAMPFLSAADAIRARKLIASMPADLSIPEFMRRTAA